MNSNPRNKNSENEEAKVVAGDDDVGRITSNRETALPLPEGDDEKLGKKRKRSSEFIQRTPNDVLCGRGIPIQNYHGNIRLHRIVDSYRDVYLATSRRDKPDLIRRIVAEVKDGGARFLKRKTSLENSRNDHWEEMDDSYAYEKVSHALRCRRYVDNAGNDNEAPHSTDGSQPGVPIDIPLSTHPTGNPADHMWFLKSRGLPPYSTGSNIRSLESLAHPVHQNAVDRAAIRGVADHQLQTRRLLELQNRSSLSALNPTFSRTLPGLRPLFGGPSLAFSPNAPQVASTFQSQSVGGLLDFPLRSSVHPNLPLALPRTSTSETYSSSVVPHTVLLQESSFDSTMKDKHRDMDHGVAMDQSIKTGELDHTTTARKSLESSEKASSDDHGSEKGKNDDQEGARDLRRTSARSRNPTGSNEGVGDHSSLPRVIDQPKMQEPWQLETNVPRLELSSTSLSAAGIAGLPSQSSGYFLSNRLQPTMHIPSSIASLSRVTPGLAPPSLLLNTATRYGQLHRSSLESGLGLTVNNPNQIYHRQQLHQQPMMMYHQPASLFSQQQELLLGSHPLWATMIPREMVAGRPTQETNVIVPNLHHDGSSSTNNKATTTPTIPTTDWSVGNSRAASSSLDDEAINRRRVPQSGFSNRSNDHDKDQEDDFDFVSRKDVKK